MWKEICLWWHNYNADRYQDAINACDVHMAFALNCTGPESDQAYRDTTIHRDRYIIYRDYHLGEIKRLSPQRLAGEC